MLTKVMKGKQAKIISICLTVAALFFVCSYQYESGVYDCQLCGNRKITDITRLWFLPLISKESNKIRHPVKAGHVHEWRYYGGYCIYGYNGWLRNISYN